MENNLKMVKELLEYMTDMDLPDILGIARLVGAEEQDDFQDFITEICLKFQDKSRKERKQIVKLAKEVRGYNKDVDTIRDSLKDTAD